MPLLEEYFYNRRDRLDLLRQFSPERLLAQGRPEDDEDNEDDGDDEADATGTA